MPDPHPMPQVATASEPFRRHLAELQEIRRSLPPGAPAGLKRRLSLAIQVAASPCCSESQADGVPCGSATTSCDQCARALEFIDRVRAEIETSFHGGAGSGEETPEL